MIKILYTGLLILFLFISANAQNNPVIINKNLKQQVKPIISSNIQQILQDEYENKHYQTTLFVTLEWYRDNIRHGQSVGVTVRFTDGSSTNTLTYEAHRIFVGSKCMMEVTFRGSIKRIYAVEIPIFEIGRTPSQTDDVADLGYKVWARTIETTENSKKWVENKLLVADTLSHITIVGSGVIQTPVLNPMKTYPEAIKTALPNHITFQILNSGDGIKAGFTKAKFLIKLKDGSVIETDIANGNKPNFLIRGETTQNINWNDISKIGLMYKFPNSFTSRDDWVIKGMTVSYKSTNFGPLRIFTDWNKEIKLNGDGAGTTWWSDDLQLP